MHGDVWGDDCSLDDSFHSWIDSRFQGAFLCAGYTWHTRMEDNQRLQTSASKRCWIFTEYVSISRYQSSEGSIDLCISLNSCMLVYALRNSDRPFAASLRGIKLRSTIEDEVLVSRRFSMSTSNSPNEKQFSMGSCSPSSAYSPITPTPAPRERRCWLPPLEVIPESNHPTLQSRLDRIAWEHSQENLHTPTVHPVPPLPVPTNTTSCQTPSQTQMNESPSTIKSPTLCSPNSDSIYSRNTSGLSYHGASHSLPSIYSHTTLDTINSDSVYPRDSSTQSSHGATSSHLPSFSRSTYGSTKSYSIYSRQPSTRSSYSRISHSVSLTPNNNSFSSPNKDSLSPPNNNSFAPNNNPLSSPNNNSDSASSYVAHAHTESNMSSNQSSSHGILPIHSRSSSRSTNSDILSHYARTLSTHGESSPDSAILYSPPPSPENESTPDLPPIPERYLHELSPSRPHLHDQSKPHPSSRNHPHRPDSSPSMPPARFWTYARAQQRRYNAFAQTSSSQKRLHPIHSQENLQHQPHTPRKSPKSPISKPKSPGRSLILRGDAVLLATPGRAVLRMNMNKGNIAVVNKEGSWEQLRGRSERGIWGKEMDWEMLLEYLRGEQGAEGKENDSRALVKVRREWEDKMRVMDQGEGKRVGLGETEVPPMPPRWQFGWI